MHIALEGYLQVICVRVCQQLHNLQIIHNLHEIINHNLEKAVHAQNLRTPQNVSRITASDAMIKGL